MSIETPTPAELESMIASQRAASDAASSTQPLALRDMEIQELQDDLIATMPTYTHFKIDDLCAQAKERNALAAQLPDGMKHCTIVFKECAKGHGWLTATNWVQHECPTCEREALAAEVEGLNQLCADYKQLEHIAGVAANQAHDECVKAHKAKESAEAEVERLREESDRVTGALSKTVADQIIRAESAERRCDAAVALVRAVTCEEFSGIKCNDVGGKNWFDLQEELLKEAK